VVTLEDVLEILTGEIVDETDRQVDLRRSARARRADGLSLKPER
jgi:CBS domain containing-hemolysin-like protein